jgi:hypothetical protein
MTDAAFYWANDGGIPIGHVHPTREAAETFMIARVINAIDTVMARNDQPLPDPVAAFEQVRDYMVSEPGGDTTLWMGHPDDSVDHEPIQIMTFSELEVPGP